MIIARRIRPSFSLSALTNPLVTIRQQPMCTKTIAVLDLGDLKDGQMYVSCHTPLSSAGDCRTGGRSSLIQERFSCLVWVTRSMRPALFAPITVPRSSKASSQPTAGSSGENSEPLVLACQLPNPKDVVHGTEVYTHYKPVTPTPCSCCCRSLFQYRNGRYWFVVGSRVTITLPYLFKIQRMLPRRQPYIPSKPMSPMARFMSQLTPRIPPRRRLHDHKDSSRLAARSAGPALSS
jgi:hypothetical protein